MYSVRDNRTPDFKAQCHGERLSLPRVLERLPLAFLYNLFKIVFQTRFVRFATNTNIKSKLLAWNSYLKQWSVGQWRREFGHPVRQGRFAIGTFFCHIDCVFR